MWASLFLVIIRDQICSTIILVLGSICNNVTCVRRTIVYPLAHFRIADFLTQRGLDRLHAISWDLNFPRISNAESKYDGDLSLKRQCLKILKCYSHSCRVDPVSLVSSLKKSVLQYTKTLENRLADGSCFLQYLAFLKDTATLCNTMQHSRERCYTKCSTCEMCGWSIIAYQDRQKSLRFDITVGLFAESLDGISNWDHLPSNGLFSS